MKRDYTVQSLESVIPPRCRKPRFMEQEQSLTVNIKEVSANAVKDMFIVHEYDCEPRKIIRYRNQNYIQLQDRRPDWRNMDAKEEDHTKESGKERTPLWINQTTENILDNYLEWILGIRFDYNKPFETQKASIKERADKIIIVDGNFYTKCTEPYYSVITFGLGHNHGGTFINVKFTEPKQKKVTGYPATDKEGAVKAVLGVAESRGDDKYYELIRESSDYITVLADDAVRKEYTYTM